LINRLFLALLVAPAVACAQPSTTPKPVSFVHADTAALRQRLDSLAGAHRGVVGYSIIDIENGDRLSLRGDEKFPTASLIKVPILVTVYDLVRRNMISLDDPISMLKIDQVPGSGILQHLHSGLTLTVNDALALMITISDNTATNLLLDRIIIRRVWDKMDSLGLRQTRVHSKSFLRNSSVAMDSSVKYGLGVTTPNEMARLFELLARGKAVSPSADSSMLALLEKNTMDRMLQRYAGDVRMAHKDGEGNEVRTECALLYLRNRVVACVLTQKNADQRWVVDHEAELTMARMGEAIIRAWGPPEKK
jgi:beta-lactamase class A